MSQIFEVELTEHARSDLVAARIWLTQSGSGLRSRLRLSRISRALIELQFNPLRWPIGPYRQARERFVDGYTIRYVVDPDRSIVSVLRVFGPYQNRSDP